MAYRGRQRRTPRRRNSRRPTKNFGYMAMGQKIYKDVQRLKGLINVEFKCNDPLRSSAITPNATGTLSSLVGLARGDDSDDRDGRQVRWKSVQVAITFIIHSSAVATQIRCILFIDKQPNATLAITGDLLDTVAITTFRNLDNRKRFVILWDKVVSLSNQGVKAAYIDMYKQMDMKTIYDDSTAGDIIDIETNAMYLFVFSNESTNTPTVTRSVRLRFLDN